IFNQFLNVLLTQVIKIVLLVNVDKNVIPLKKRTKSPHSFLNGLSFIYMYWSISFFLCFYQFYRAVHIYAHWIFSLFKRYKFLSVFYVRTKPSIVDLYGLPFINSNFFWKFKKIHRFLISDRIQSLIWHQACKTRFFLIFNRSYLNHRAKFTKSYAYWLSCFRIFTKNSFSYFPFCIFCHIKHLGMKI